MGFLRRVKVPDELPDLAIEDGSVVPTQTSQQRSENTLPSTQNSTPPTQLPPKNPPTTQQEPKQEEFLEFKDSVVEKAERSTETILEMSKEDKEREGFFSKVLEDINDEMSDLGRLGEWYEQQFAQKDVVSDMKSYWEGNKADMIIRSFGSEYKRKIAEKVERLRALEDDWRTIYFSLVKKEEEMKQEEKVLKETVSEFVELCKRKKQINGEENQEKKADSQTKP